jgi:hypothetical protein
MYFLKNVRIFWYILCNCYSAVCWSEAAGL